MNAWDYEVTPDRVANMYQYYTDQLVDRGEAKIVSLPTAAYPHGMACSKTWHWFLMGLEAWPLRKRPGPQVSQLD